MCRFLIAKSVTKTNFAKLLNDFAIMCQKSKTQEGDWQGDGWGMGWREDNQWNSYHSLKPIWKDRERLKNVPLTNQIMIHARSASFAHQKGVIEYNQPHINKQYCFVFNGLVRGVKLTRPIKGKIGSQKILLLLIEQLKLSDPSKALKKTYDFISNHSEKIKGFNVGVGNGDNFYIISDFTEADEYFSLRLYNSSKLKIICSEELNGFNWKKIEKKMIVKI